MKSDPKQMTSRLRYLNSAMKQYHFKINCGDSVMNGVKVSAKANSEREARIKVAEAILIATRDLKIESLELLGTGRMTATRN